MTRLTTVVFVVLALPLLASAETPTTKPAKEVPLSSLYSTSKQEGMQQASDSPTMKEGDFPQVGLVWGKDGKAACKAAVTVLPAKAKSETTLTSSADKDAQLWVLVYFGTSGSLPPQWVIDSVTIPKENQWEINFHHAKDGMMTMDLFPYYLWVPLAKGLAGKCVVRLVDSGKVAEERAFVVGDKQATTQPATQASEAVRVNGLDFEVVAATVWAIPATGKATPIPLALKVTNTTDKDIRLDLLHSFTVQVKDANGKELQPGKGPDLSSRVIPPLLVKQGQSVTVDRTAYLETIADKPGQFRLRGFDGPRGGWQFEGLSVGQYTLSVDYDHSRTDPRNDSLWVGKATTKGLAVAIADESSVSSKPVTKDGLQVTVTLPKATFAADEQPRFTVGFKNVSEEDFLLYDVKWFWAWDIRFEDLQAKGPWQLRALFEVQRTKPESLTVEPGKSVEVVVDLGKVGPFEFAWGGDQEQPVAPLKHLKPGKYRLTIPITLNGPPAGAGKWKFPHWTGTITTEPVEFEISDKPPTGGTP